MEPVIEKALDEHYLLLSISTQNVCGGEDAPRALPLNPHIRRPLLHHRHPGDLLHQSPAPSPTSHCAGIPDSTHPVEEGAAPRLPDSLVIWNSGLYLVLLMVQAFLVGSELNNYSYHCLSQMHLSGVTRRGMPSLCVPQTYCRTF